PALEPERGTRWRQGRAGPGGGRRARALGPARRCLERPRLRVPARTFEAAALHHAAPATVAAHAGAVLLPSPPPRRALAAPGARGRGSGLPSLRRAEAFRRLSAASWGGP